MPLLQLYRIEVFGWNYSVVPTTVQNGRVFYTIRSTSTRIKICEISSSL
jgi:hypothetical protein